MIYKLQITTALESEYLLNEFHNKFPWLKQHGYILSIQNQIVNQNNMLIDITLHGSTGIDHLKDEDIIYIFKHQISEFLAEHIIRDWEDKLAWKEVNRKARHILSHDQITVMDKALDFLKRCNSNESLNLLMNFGRKNKMAHRIFDYIYYKDFLVVEGFINFCLNDYLTEIKMAVDLAHEELKNEKEYNEFIKLLRYFVDTQPPAVVEVNIMMDSYGRFSLWDEKGVSIEKNHFNYYWGDMVRGEITLDDMLISILITIAPRRIILHNTGQNQENASMAMIKKVFEKRIIECPGCQQCYQYQSNESTKTWRSEQFLPEV